MYKIGGKIMVKDNFEENKKDSNVERLLHLKM